ncbi:MAG: type IV secretion system DNA-binding domain-containing protein [Planctomycetota bacterium]
MRRLCKSVLYRRGRTEVKSNKSAKRKPRDSLRWGNAWLPASAATGHFLAVGTTGSGKSQIQKLLMSDALRQIAIGSDRRAVNFDAKNDISGFLEHIDVKCPVFTLNPFDARKVMPTAVAWDIASDITGPARALNLARSLIPAERSGTNQYFSDAARLVVAAVVESMIRHSGRNWTFSDLVFGCLSRERIEAILERDAAGRDILTGFLGDDRVSYSVASTVFSKMSYFKPVAALWQRFDQRLSIRQWLAMDAILLLGANAKARASLDAINEQVFRVLTEEVDMLPNSTSRRIWCWIDEARLSGPLLQSDLVPFLAVKGRSRGVALVVAFQDIEGLREAAGERLANEIISQMSHKALLRAESEGSANFASKLCGQFETIEYFESDSSLLSQTVSGQRVVRDAVLASEFYQIPPASPLNGITGYFLSPHFGAQRVTITGDVVHSVIISDDIESRHVIPTRPESEQWIREWARDDYRRLTISEIEQAPPKLVDRGQQHHVRNDLRARQGTLAGSIIDHI